MRTLKCCWLAGSLASTGQQAAFSRGHAFLGRALLLRGMQGAYMHLRPFDVTLLLCGVQGADIRGGGPAPGGYQRAGLRVAGQDGGMGLPCCSLRHMTCCYHVAIVHVVIVPGLECGKARRWQEDRKEWTSAHITQRKKDKPRASSHEERS